MELSPQNIPNIRCLAVACDRLGLQYAYHDRNHNLIGIDVGETLYFANASTPFNRHSVAKICRDKQFSFQILKDVVRMPKTIGFLDPACDEKYQKYVTHFSLPEIAAAIENIFSFPMIVKMNSGAQGSHVYLCKTSEEIHMALKTIYDKNSHLFDYIALAQEYVSIKKEFRIVIYENEIVLAYEKDISEATFSGNLSPLHYENSRAVVVADQDLLRRIGTLIQPLSKILGLSFAGLDIALDKNGDLWLLELNANPGFEHFVKDNGDEPLVEMYTKILRTYCRI